LEPPAIPPRRPLPIGKPISALNVPGLLREVFFEIVQQAQGIWILLMASQQAAALNEFGQQLGFEHVTPMWEGGAIKWTFSGPSGHRIALRRSMANRSRGRTNLNVRIQIIFNSEQY
jgi:hypothetical protein